MSISFKLTLKFTARSFRRRVNGKGTNEWRTIDSPFVEYLVKLKSPLNIVKSNFDTVFGQLNGNMKASVGLESVFQAQETSLK